jgi:uncharacterized protein YjbI with pentapeptide repeats
MNRDEALKLLSCGPEGIAEWNRQRKPIGIGQMPCLDGTDFRGADLRGYNLSGIDFANSDFTNVDLGDAQLSFADVSGAHLVDASLRGALLAQTRSFARMGRSQKRVSVGAAFPML